MKKTFLETLRYFSKRCFRWCFVGVMVGLFSGCQTRGIFDPPGTMDAQRTRAMKHDPFPSDEIGPTIYGGRPLGFEQPRNEATQLKMTSPPQGGAVVEPPPIFQSPVTNQQNDQPPIYQPPIYQPPGMYQPNPAGF